MNYMIILLVLEVFQICCSQVIISLNKSETVFDNSLSKGNPRIIGGVPASIEDSKYVVSLRLKSLDKNLFGLGHICGGCLISSNVALTAAHCLLDYDAKPERIRGENEFQVVMGTLNRFNKTKNTLVFDIRKIIHKGFRVEDFSNDIGMIFFKGNVHNTHPTVQPIHFHDSVPKPNSLCRIHGWGVTQSGNKRGSSILLTASISLIKPDDCLKIYGENLKHGMICAGVMDGGIDSCQGDSGGPLICENRLVGLVSWGEKCGVAKWPGIYTGIISYRSWIESSLTQYNKRLSISKNSSFVASIRSKSLSQKNFGNGHFCSGAFYIPSNKNESNLVVTSAYCFYLSQKIGSKNLIVVFNAPDRFKINSKTQVYDVNSFEIHENFSMDSSDFNNIAVLKLNKYLTNEEIDVLELNNEPVLQNNFCYTYSWNTALNPSYQGDEILQVGNATAYNLEVCNKIFNNQLKNGMFCAGNISSLQDEVQADIGGVLVCNNKLTGIMLQRFDVAFSGFPSVYTDIAYYKDWLENSSPTISISILTIICKILFYQLF